MPEDISSAEEMVTAAVSCRTCTYILVLSLIVHCHVDAPVLSSTKGDGAVLWLGINITAGQHIA